MNRGDTWILWGGQTWKISSKDSWQYSKLLFFGLWIEMEWKYFDHFAKISLEWTSALVNYLHFTFIIMYNHKTVFFLEVRSIWSIRNSKNLITASLMVVQGDESFTVVPVPVDPLRRDFPYPYTTILTASCNHVIIIWVPLDVEDVLLVCCDLRNVHVHKTCGRKDTDSKTTIFGKIVELFENSMDF